MGNRTLVPMEVESGSASERWQFEGGFTLDLASRTLSDPSGNEVPLWRSEFALLATLLRAPGRALSREQLLDAVVNWMPSPIDRGAVKAHDIATDTEIAEITVESFDKEEHIKAES